MLYECLMAPATAVQTAISVVTRNPINALCSTLLSYDSNNLLQTFSRIPFLAQYMYTS